MKKSDIKPSLALIIPAMLVMLGFAASCNSKKSEAEEIAVTVSTVAVKSFSLKANSDVLSHLDSVFFSIDLQRGVIFNADSLPKGTDVSKIVPLITFANTMAKAELVSGEGTDNEKVSDYLESPSDSIDFSGKVLLRVTAADGINSYEYTIKVNVHNADPEAMVWDQLAVTSLPSRQGAPVSQRTVDWDGLALCLMEESDGSFTISTTDDIDGADWSRTAISLPFTPDIRSLTSAGGNLYILSTSGRLFTSADAQSWTDTGLDWISIVGAFGDCVLGVKNDGTTLRHCHYPASAQVADPEMASDFPLSGRSDLRSFTNEWTPGPIAICAGGVMTSGEMTSAVWAFDGDSWTVIGNLPGGPVTDATLFRYVVYGYTPAVFQHKEYEVWMLVGGLTPEGLPNRHTYYSPDNGVNWKTGSELLDLPDQIEGLRQLDALVEDSTLDADLADSWSRAAAPNPGRWYKRAWEINGNEITWKCPYIYLFGGTSANGALADEIWRGVLAGLTFTPVI